MPTLRTGKMEDWSVIKVLLLESGLPVEDLDADKLDGFLVAEDGADVVGAIGLHRYGTIGLLRSLVVTKTARSLGLGGKLVAALVSASRVAGVTELWLLTIDAEKFFERHGFLITNRDAAPSSIQQTKEFSDLCPGTAFLMRKELY